MSAISADGSPATSSVSLRLTTSALYVAGCFVELHPDGSVVLVVDGERLFRFESLDALLLQYDLVRGARITLASSGAAGRVIVRARS